MVYVNYIHTGDPVFPVLTNMLQFPETAYWNSEFEVLCGNTGKERVAAGPKHNQLAPVPDILDFQCGRAVEGVPDWSRSYFASRCDRDIAHIGWAARIARPPDHRRHLLHHLVLQWHDPANASPFAGLSAGIGHSVSGSYRVGTTDASALACKRGAECCINYPTHGTFVIYRQLC